MTLKYKKPDNCLDNLKYCNAACCRNLTFTMRHMRDEMLYYYRKHGCTVRRMPDRSWQVSVPSKCDQLEDNKCKLHGTPDKPKPCVEFGEQHMKRAIVPRKCIYSDNWEKEVMEDAEELIPLGGIQ